ncbi:MAG: hypothetical protein II376_03335 [Clostridia bacterium]|nr:hypothetical protein [Clostridia bacterium]
MDNRIRTFINELRSIDPAPEYASEMIAQLEGEEARLGPDPSEDDITAVLLPHLIRHMKATPVTDPVPLELENDEDDSLPFDDDFDFSSGFEENDIPEDFDESPRVSPLIQFLTDMDNDPEHRELYANLRGTLEQKLEELGPDHSFEEGEAVLNDCLREDILNLINNHIPMHSAGYLANTVRGILNDMEITSDERETPHGTLFSFGLLSDDEKVCADFSILAARNAMDYTIRAYFPCIVDQKYAMPVTLLCNKLYGKIPMGCCIFYDAEDSAPFGSNISINFGHRLDSPGSVNPDLFKALIYTMFEAIEKLNPIVSRYAVGKLNRTERSELADACHAIIEDMEEYL